jgi:protocatechuate 3,4-dioxygenase beta subunit
LEDSDMAQPRPARLTRREFIGAAISGIVSFVLAACGRQASPQPEATASSPTLRPPTETSLTQSPVPNPQSPPSTAELVETPAAAGQLPPTPACGDQDEPTLAQTEGPFFTPNSPERTSLVEAGMAGTPMTLTGYVLSTNCQPVAGALLDFWHADDAGVYDNVSYRLRGHQFADDQGRFRLTTITPGLYPGRTRHFHVKVQAPNQPVLTTQLYFPEEPDNERDGIFDPALLMDVQEGDEGKQATFSFVLNAG